MVQPPVRGTLCLCMGFRGVGGERSVKGSMPLCSQEQRLTAVPYACVLAVYIADVTEK